MALSRLAGTDCIQGAAFAAESEYRPLSTGRRDVATTEPAPDISPLVISCAIRSSGATYSRSSTVA